jgi:hypothetical protein
MAAPSGEFRAMRVDRIGRFLLVFAFLLALSGCATQDIPGAHKGRTFSRSGLFTLYRGGGGLDGPVLKPGTHFLGLYDELRVVDCSMTPVSEKLDTLTKDGVHFSFEMSIRFSADCSDEAVVHILNTVTTDKGDTISPGQMYATFIRPAIGEASRELVSPYRANEMNEKQAEVLAGIKKRFTEIMSTRERKVIVLHEINLKNLKFPDEMDAANLERAVQAVMRDKAIAERERVTAEIETMRMRKELAERESDVAAVRVERIGEALKKYPEYLQYDLQLKLPEIYREAGSRGNLILAAPVPPQITLPLPRNSPNPKLEAPALIK